MSIFNKFKCTLLHLVAFYQLPGTPWSSWFPFLINSNALSCIFNKFGSNLLVVFSFKHLNKCAAWSQDAPFLINAHEHFFEALIFNKVEGIFSCQNANNGQLCLRTSPLVLRQNCLDHIFKWILLNGSRHSIESDLCLSYLCLVLIVFYQTLCIFNKYMKQSLHHAWKL